MDTPLAADMEVAKFEDDESIIEFENIYNDELEEIARDRDLDDIRGLYDSEIGNYF